MVHKTTWRNLGHHYTPWEDISRTVNAAGKFRINLKYNVLTQTLPISQVRAVRTILLAISITPVVALSSQTCGHF